MNKFELSSQEDQRPLAGDVEGIDNGDFPADEIKKLLSTIDVLPSQAEPDESDLSLEEVGAEDIDSDVTNEDILVAQKVMAELGDDPVRLYLKDIGTIDLLDVSHEFWLSARMYAVRRIDAISRQHPIAKRGISPSLSIYRAIFEEMVTAWLRVSEDVHRFEFDCPNLINILVEAQKLRKDWERLEPSYLRNYLNKSK